MQEIVVDSSWRSRHAGTSPLFVDTLQSSVAQTLASKPIQQSVVKATQINLQFSETQAGKLLYPTKLFYYVESILSIDFTKGHVFYTTSE